MKVYTMSITLLNVENKIFTYPTKLINILYFDLKRLSIQKIEDDDETCIYNINDDKYHFCLIIDNLKGYFKINDDDKYLAIIFTSENQKMMYETIWEKIKEAINNEISDYSKYYTVPKFDSNDVLPLDSIINIHSLEIIIRYVFKDDNKYYPQIYIHSCLYEL